MRFLRRIRFLLRRETNAADVAEELGVHLRMLEDEHRAAGMSPEEALEAARRRLGSPTRAREEARRV